VKAEVTTGVGSSLSLVSVRAAIDGDGVEFDVQQAHGTGRFTPLAELTVTTAIAADQDHDVSFDPTHNTTDGVGWGPNWLTSLRERAYLRSRHGCDAPDGAT
jgi:hypothetical protein